MLHGGRELYIKTVWNQPPSIWLVWYRQHYIHLFIVKHPRTVSGSSPSVCLSSAFLSPRLNKGFTQSFPCLASLRHSLHCCAAKLFSLIFIFCPVFRSSSDFLLLSSQSATRPVLFYKLITLISNPFNNSVIKNWVSFFVIALAVSSDLELPLSEDLREPFVMQKWYAGKPSIFTEQNLPLLPTCYFMLLSLY